MVNALRAGMTWAVFLRENYWVTALHIEAHKRNFAAQHELEAWGATHLYRAMCGENITVDDLMGRYREKVDLVNDPFALDKLADADD